MARTERRLTIAIWPLVVLMTAGAAQACEDVIYRIWQKGKDDRHFAFGEEVSIPLDQEAHLYIHYRSRSKHPFTTSAEIGYPSSLGLSGDGPQDISKLLTLKGQSAQDRTDGRIVLTAKAAGSTELGYRIRAVTSPGSLDLVPKNCRTGVVQLKIGDEPVGEPPEQEVTAPRESADRLVVSLYQGLMRRKTVRGYPESQVEMLLQEGRQGAVELAVEMVGSTEFRDQIRERTLEEHAGLTAASSDRQIFEQLLNDIYLSLYGGKNVDAKEHARNLADLSDCLSVEARRDLACERLGRGLVGHELFAEEHAELLASLSSDYETPVIGRERGRHVEHQEK